MVFITCAPALLLVLVARAQTLAAQGLQLRNNVWTFIEGLAFVIIH